MTNTDPFFAEARAMGAQGTEPEFLELVASDLAERAEADGQAPRVMLDLEGDIVLDPKGENEVFADLYVTVYEAGFDRVGGVFIDTSEGEFTVPSDHVFKQVP